MSDSILLKQCSKCGQQKPAVPEFFYARKEGKDGFRNQCKQCIETRNQTYRLETIPESKQCTKCRQVYPVTPEYFSRDVHNKDGFRASCKNCENSTDKHILKSLPVPDGHKRCLKCEEVFPATSEYFPSVKGAQRNHCRKCVNTNQRRLHRLKHPQDIVPEGYKRCFDCQQIMPATREYFNVANSAKGKLHGRCKPCTKAHREASGIGSKVIPLPEGSMKQCTACKQTFPATTKYFSKRNIVYGGLSSMCKACISIRHKKTYEHMPFCEDKGVKMCIHCKQTKPATTDYFHARKTGQFGLASICKECKNTYDKQYRHDHPEVGVAKDHRRRTKKRGSSGNYTVAQIQEQLKRQKYRCYYAACGRAKFKKDKTGKYIYHVDHTYPISRVSSDIPANDISYLVLACPHCNLSKGDKFPWEYFEGGRLL